jgi:serine acetyltransferase
MNRCATAPQVEDGLCLGAGAKILDGVRIDRGATCGEMNG